MFNVAATFHMAVQQLTFGVVVIGRNEGERLKRCIVSLTSASAIVYVDSGSSDESADWATGQGIDVVVLDDLTPFTAARARNAGLARLLQIASDLDYVQFIDGDCEMDKNWPFEALAFLASHPTVGVIFGELQERHPDRSIYNWLCDKEWAGAPGPTNACGGIAMMRTAAVQQVGGFCNGLVAGEEPELCLRLRQVGWEIWRIKADMALHDANILRFSQWWRRAVRAGHASAEGAYLHRAAQGRYMVWECYRAWLWGLIIPACCVLLTYSLGPVALAFGVLLYLAQIVRLTARSPGPLQDRLYLSAFQTLSRFPEFLGQLKFWRDRLFGKPSTIIEYK